MTGIHAGDCFGAAPGQLVVAFFQGFQSRFAILAGQNLRFLVLEQVFDAALDTVEGLQCLRLVLGNARRNQRVRRDFDGLGVALVLHGFIGEQGREDFFIAHGAVGRIGLAAEPVGVLDGQLELVGDWLETV